MGTPFVNVKTLTIPSGGTDSDILVGLEDALVITVYAPAALTTAITVQVEPTRTGTSFRTLQMGSPFADVAIAAGKAVTLPRGAYGQLKFHAAGAEAQADVFQVDVQVET